MNLVLRYLGKMEEKRGNKQQHQKNQDDHNYTAKLWNRICDNYLKYILKQWIVFIALCDWLLKLGISIAIHLPICYPNKRRHFTNKRRGITKKATKFGLTVFTGKACRFILNLSMKPVRKPSFIKQTSTSVNNCYSLTGYTPSICCLGYWRYTFRTSTTRTNLRL